MWLTQGHQIYAAFSDTGIQKFLNGVFLARPHYFNYATAALGGGTAGVSSLSPLPVPGSAVGVDYKLEFPNVPIIQFYPNASPPPPQPVPAAPIPPLPTPYAWTLNQFVIYVVVNVSVLEPPKDLETGDVEIWAFGHPQIQTSGNTSAISLVIDDIQVSDAGTLDDIVAYVGKLMLNGLLGNLQIPTTSIAQGALGFRLEFGPDISSQQLQIWGSLV